MTPTDIGSKLHGQTAPPCPFALMGPEVARDPHPHFARLREAKAPVHYDETSGVYVVARHDRLLEVVRDTDAFSNRYEMTSLRPGGMPEEAKAILSAGIRPMDTLLTNDPPDHGRYRPLVDQVFTAERVGRMESFIQQTLDGLIDAFVADGRAEIVSQLASPLPLTVIADALGLPREDIHRIKGWSDAISEIRGLLVPPERVVQAAGEMVECQRYLQVQCEARRLEPRDDVISALVHARLDGCPLSPEELNSLLMQLMVAGNESCTNAMVAGVRRLAEDPSLAQRILTEPRSLRVFVEEVLRLDSPAQGHFRRARRAIDIGGVAIPEGALVHVRWASANRDACAFDSPDAVDLNRRNPMSHVAFGGGAHFCVGASLGRAQLRLAFAIVARRLKGLVLASDNDFVHHPIFHLRGLKRLNVTFEPDVPTSESLLTPEAGTPPPTCALLENRQHHGS